MDCSSSSNCGLPDHRGPSLADRDPARRLRGRRRRRVLYIRGRPWRLDTARGSRYELSAFAASGRRRRRVGPVSITRRGRWRGPPVPARVEPGRQQFRVYDTATGDHLGSFGVGGHPDIDDVSGTRRSVPLPGFPEGLLVVRRQPARQSELQVRVLLRGAPISGILGLRPHGVRRSRRAAVGTALPWTGIAALRLACRNRRRMA